MKKVWLITLLLISAMNLYSQPQIAYIIPDIGAPGMSTYMEIISPFNPDNPDASRGNFWGTTLDGFVNTATAKVRTLNPADSTKITFSPMIVSWDGRLISVQVFVNPNLNPNSADWQELNPEFKIPFVVQLGGNVSNVDTFYIVKPWSLGNVSGNTERVLGDGTLGKRSRRGAMIVDSLLLANATYTVSTKDCDPGTPGNQGFLPFILIAKTKIVGFSNTTISVNGETARDGHGGNGGPGGGGGGGRFCDVGPTQTGGDNGGDGFISGGKGGWNIFFPSGGGTKNYGQGTGTSGNSLNSVYPPKTAPSNYEGSGGATGHPFGKSGICTFDGNSDNPIGGYGGGSSSTQKKNGGSAGYATKGFNSLTTGAKSGGSLHGNRMVVPVAGGSGGASGNPQSLADCSGSGGGGGGAIQLFAPLINNVALQANGADGSNGTGTDAKNTRGGSGSGGFTGMASKLDLNILNMQANGGKDADGDMAGGLGRIRYDIPSWANAFNIPTEDSLKFRGPTSDTNSFVKRNFNLKGSCGDNKELYISIKPESGNWFDKQITNISGNSWTHNIDLTNFCDDSIFYCVIYQDEGQTTGTIAEHNMAPNYVMSNAATNIFRIVPDIQGDDYADTKITVCDKSEKDTLVFKIKNNGGPTLNLDVAGSYFEQPANGNNYNGFKLIKPDPATVANELLTSCDSTEFEVEYTYQSGHFGIISTKLLIPHNDLDPTRARPWEVELSVAIDSFAIAINDLSGIRLNTTDNLLDLGNICLGDTIETHFKVKNNSSFDINLLDFELTGDTVEFSASPSNVYSISRNNEIDAYVRFENPTELRQYRTRVYIKPSECEFAVDSFDVVANIVENDIKFTQNTVIIDTVHFGQVKIGFSKNVSVNVINEGIGNAFIKLVSITDPEGMFTLSNQPTEPTLPVFLDNSGTNTLKVNIDFTPNREGEHSALLKVESDLNDNPYACQGEKFIVLFAEGLKSEVTAYPLDFGNVANCQNILMDSIEVKNTGKANIQILTNGEITGSDAVYFSLSNSKSAPYTLKPNESIFYQVWFDPTIPGIGPKSATFHLVCDDSFEPDIYSLISANIENLDLKVTPNTISFGGVPVPQTRDAQIEISNEGSFDIQIVEVQISDALVKTTPNINGTLLKSGDKITLDVEVTFSEFRIIDAIIGIVTSTPCSDTIEVAVKGQGQEGEWTYNDLDFGTIAFCETSSRTFTFTNVGDPVIEFRSMRILQEDDWWLFHLQGPEPSNVPLNKDDVYTREVLFQPVLATDGIKKAKIEFTIFVNGAEKTGIVNLQGERLSGLLSSPGEVDFGKVIVSTDKTILVVLANKGKVPITISKILPIKKHPNVFSTNPVQLASPVTLLPGTTTTLELNVRFVPLDFRIYYDTLELEITEPCNEIRSIALRGEGIPALKANIWLPNLTVHPKTKNLRIPVYMEFEEKGNSISDITFKGQISFDKSVFLPISVTNNAVIVRNESIGESRFFEFTATNLDISDDDNILLEIIGDAMLGNVKSTDLILSNTDIQSVTLLDPNPAANGSITLTICDEGGDRFLEKGTPTLLYATPNPVTSTVSINGSTLESGNHSLEIVNVQGQKFRLNEWYSTGSENFDYTFDFTGYSNGMYYIILHTPGRTFTKAIFVVN